MRNDERLQGHARFTVRQRTARTVGQYVVTVAGKGDAEGEVVAFARRKVMSLKEEMTIYTDESRTSVLCTSEARQVDDFGAVHDVRDSAGAVIGSFRERPVVSLVRSAWTMEQPGTPELTGRERSWAVALLRRVWEFLPYVEFVPFLWPYHFDFFDSTATGGAKRLMSFDRKFGLRDRYVLDIASADIDRRLAIAQAVALDTLEER
ncbi:MULTISPECIES: LURP-one-related/scramblase family protein [Streptomyces]|uniref:Uncharacterized protein n=1 Tax=Streptomyces griseiscabiei TaxID=2993540 RepID=A0ABU4LHR9_9ACTN|nr:MULTISPECIES: hypothetical protein [Streptomyces]MBZ3908004.1 hypothetical protein [Streptomyces griseiscabiei]MDX2915153.1 hypothetical protein [Streptomyces griseiscabiei]